MNYYNNKTRLNRKLEKETKKQIYLLIAGILIIIFLIFMFGINTLTGVAKIFIKINEITSSPRSTQQNTNNDFFPTPILDPILSATNSASLHIMGKSINNKGKIQLYIDNDLSAETAIEQNGNFIFENIELGEGENAIKARFKSENNKFSEFSSEQKIYYIKKMPSLEIYFPSENSILTRGDQEINIEGKTEPDNQVMINGYWALMQGDGSFSYFIKLNEGDNIIKIEAADKAGNKTTKDIRVTYEP